MEDFAATVPGGAGAMADHATRNVTAMNRAAARAIGETADELTPNVLAAARARIVKPFEEVKALTGRPIAIGQSVANVADDILRQSSKMPGGQKDANLITLAQQAKALAANKGRIDGETYQLTRSHLSEAAYEANGTNKHLYGKLLEALDNSAEQSLRMMGKADLANALKTARPQYANLTMLEKGAVIEGGNVNPSRLASAMRTQDPKILREGTKSGEMVDLARVGEQFKALNPGSQTFARGIVSSPLATALTAPVAYGAAKATTGALPRGYAAVMGQSQVPGALADPITRAMLQGILMNGAQ
jgi:hypothetical protein